MKRSIILASILICANQHIKAQQVAYLHCSNNQCAYHPSQLKSVKKSAADNITFKLNYNINSLKSMNETYVVEANSQKGISIRVGNFISKNTLFYTEFGYVSGRINTLGFLESVKASNTLPNKQMTFQENNSRKAKLTNMTISAAVSRRFKLSKIELEPYIKLSASAVNTNLEYQVAYTDSIVKNRIINIIHGGKTNLLISPAAGFCVNKQISSTFSLIGGMDLNYNFGRRSMSESHSADIFKSTSDKTTVTNYQFTTQAYLGLMWQPSFL